MAEGTYGHLFKKMEIRSGQQQSGGNADYIAGFNGEKLEGLKLNLTWAMHSGLGDWHAGMDPHVHDYDEVLLFVGLDPEKPDYLGAEIEISVGMEQEKHVVSTPSVVVLPAGTVHGPLVTRKVDRMYGFSAICLNGEHETKWLGEKE